MFNNWKNEVFFFMFTCKYLRWFFRLFMTKSQISYRVVKLFEEYIVESRRGRDADDW